MRVTANATYTGSWWVVEVPEVDGAFTQARRLDQVEAMVRDAVSLLEGVEPESVEVTLVPQLAEDLSGRIQALHDVNARLFALQAEASSRTRGLVDALRAAGMTVRDVGRVLGVSPQRISQLAPSQKAPVVKRLQSVGGTKKAAKGRPSATSTSVDRVAARSMRSSRTGRFVSKSTGTSAAKTSAASKLARNSQAEEWTKKK